ncbi:hypothetical protein HanPSC8_Chr14g0629021 [Helianthus annuus]|nr:hypothetical protein HanPSC8_Chr14g0629021 [Helianthus annuus]
MWRWVIKFLQEQMQVNKGADDVFQLYEEACVQLRMKFGCYSVFFMSCI